jgi:hypothetical protein
MVQALHFSNPEHPLHGVYLKLKRADENVLNLDSEIDRFFKACKYPVIPDRNDERVHDAFNYYRELKVPLRLSVLAGESSWTAFCFCELLECILPKKLRLNRGSVRGCSWIR